MSQKNYTIFIFRRDLRLIDNNGLNFAQNIGNTVIPVFIFTSEQVTNKNKYKSDNAVQFMCESLNELKSLVVRYSNILSLLTENKVSTKSLNKTNRILPELSSRTTFKT